MKCPFGIFFSAFRITFPYKLNRDQAILALLPEVLGGCQSGIFLKAGIKNRF